jgi:lipopolysaccharide export system protein LptC
MMSLLRAAWDRVSLYLPILLMGVLALGTYWLVRSTPEFTPPEAARPPSHDPDYFMKKFSVKTFDNAGRLKSEVTGQEARHYADTDTLEIDNVRIRSFDPQGRLTIATAKRALTNGDASEVQLFGEARVVREAVAGKVSSPRLEFQGEFLHAYLNAERIRSNKPVLLIRGQDRFSADNLDYDNLERSMQLRGRVKGLLVPSTAK